MPLPLTLAHSRPWPSPRYPSHGRLLLIVTGEPGSTRRLVDGLTLPRSQNNSPQIILKLLTWQAPSERHGNTTPRSWRILTEPPTRDQGETQTEDTASILSSPS